MADRFDAALVLFALFVVLAVARRSWSANRWRYAGIAVVDAQVAAKPVRVIGAATKHTRALADTVFIAKRRLLLVVCLTVAVVVEIIADFRRAFVDPTVAVVVHHVADVVHGWDVFVDITVAVVVHHIANFDRCSESLIGLAIAVIVESVADLRALFFVGDTVAVVINTIADFRRPLDTRQTDFADPFKA